VVVKMERMIRPAPEISPKKIMAIPSLEGREVLLEV
jgi:hypothetical protein